MPTSTISIDCGVAIPPKACQLDAKVAETHPDSGSNPTDDTWHELVLSIRDLNDDEQREFIALIWEGRGDFTLAECKNAKRSAGGIGRKHTPRHIAEIPLVAATSRMAFRDLITQCRNIYTAETVALMDDRVSGPPFGTVSHAS